MFSNRTSSGQRTPPSSTTGSRQSSTAMQRLRCGEAIRSRS
jgi:hypothetical protein